MNFSKAHEAAPDIAAPEIGPIEGDVTSAGLTIQSFLELVVQHGATDLHISAESPPMMRVDGQYHENLDVEKAKRILDSLGE